MRQRLWYASDVDNPAFDLALDGARAAASHAQDVRQTYAKRVGRGDRQRQTDIQHALNRLKRVMKPIRSELARIPYVLRANSDPDLELQQEQLLAASDLLQRERRKLWKMQPKKKKEKKK